MPSTDKPKPGIKTSECWITIGAALQHAAISLGLVGSPSDFQHAAGILTSFLFALCLAYQYLSGRQKLKTKGADPEQLMDTVRRLTYLLDRDETKPSEGA